MSETSRLWRWLAIVFFVSFAALGLIGREIYQSKPPIPGRVVTADGEVLFTAQQIERGQEAWRAAGGQQLGSVWGHGSYVAPDWSADWLHREALALRDIWAMQRHGAPYEAIDADRQAVLAQRLKQEMRRNTYDPENDLLVVSNERAAAIRAVAAHYDALFGDDPALAPLRAQYALHPNALPNEEDRTALAAFFFWAAWSAVTDRPDQPGVSYTNNWPHEPLVGNTPTAANGIWSVVSVILLIAGIAVMVWLHSRRPEAPDPAAPAKDPLLTMTPTPSMRATLKYFYVVIALLLVQVAMGVVTAHYAVEGEGFFGIPLAQILPYTVSRTIHTQFAVLWIATAWLATGLYIAPLLSGREPAHQKLGVDVLFWALIVVALGSTLTGWMGLLERAGVEFAFWLGNQGLEFTSMGRVWQLALFAGLLFWLFLVARGLWPALRKPSESRGLIALVFLAATCIGLFYAASLAWGRNTHYSMVEYWRWWLVHLWVEGFFEVFATAVVALLFARLGLVRTAAAYSAIVLETIVFLFGGILGTLHHLYFTGTPTSVIAVGAVFSALEVVPLALLGVEALRNYRRSRAAPWVQAYRWAILSFVAVGFWNIVGAGLLGFAINPPIALYYVQGLNLTPAHGHAALFGVYGMLGIGLTLFCLRGLAPRETWSDGLLKPAFWMLNVGLALMVFVSLVPAGVYQAWASITQGLWYARSPEIVHSPVMEALVWLRVPGDIVFALGVLCLALFALRLPLKTRPALATGTRRPAEAGRVTP